MKRKGPGLFLLLGFIALAAFAEEEKPVIQMNPLFFEGLGIEESRFIESLLQSYLSDIGVLGGGLPASRPPDYTITGNIRLERDGHMFLLEITNTRTGESFAFTSVYKSTGELALKARSLLESAFSAGGLESEKKPASRPERLSENLVIGTWKGEAGIEMVRLQRGGRGVAVFSSGAQMVLSYTIENNVLKIQQVSPNQERFYYPFPQEVARQIAAAADPVSWELSLYQQGSVLSGVKLSTGVRLENGAVAELLPAGDVREVVWAKSGH
jgi:hypothetical protein